MRLAKIISFEQFAAQEAASQRPQAASGLFQRSWEEMAANQARIDAAIADKDGVLRAEYVRLVEEGHIIVPETQAEASQDMPERSSPFGARERERAAAAARIQAKKEAHRRAAETR